MSRYNDPKWELVKPFYDVFFLLVIVPLVFILACVARARYEDTWGDAFERATTWIVTSVVAIIKRIPITQVPDSDLP